MSRIYYDEWDEPDWGLRAGRFFAKVRSTMLGKPGRQALLDLEQALLAMPEKSLIAGALCTPDGEVCALGSLARYRNVSLEGMDHPDDQEASIISDWAKEKLGVSTTLAWVIQDMNDEEFDRATPEDRWRGALEWVRKWLYQPEETFKRYKAMRLP